MIDVTAVGHVAHLNEYRVVLVQIGPRTTIANGRLADPGPVLTTDQHRIAADPSEGRCGQGRCRGAPSKPLDCSTGDPRQIDQGDDHSIDAGPTFESGQPCLHRRSHPRPPLLVDDDLGGHLAAPSAKDNKYGVATTLTQNADRPIDQALIAHDHWSLRPTEARSLASR